MKQPNDNPNLLQSQALRSLLLKRPVWPQLLHDCKPGKYFDPQRGAGNQVATAYEDATLCGYSLTASPSASNSSAVHIKYIM